MPTENKGHEIPKRLTNELATNDEPEQYIRVKHSVNLGDLYAAMGAIKKYHDITHRKAIICQTIDTLAAYYPGAEHPTKNKDGAAVCMNEEMWNMVKPLVESQEYVHSFEKYAGQPISLDFDTIRGKTNVNLPHGAIQGWIPLAFPDIAFNLSDAWIMLDDNCPDHIREQVQNKIIINFTERYRNPIIDYFFLKNYIPDLIFAGTEKEYWLFCNKWQLTIPRLEINNFLELGYALKAARFSLSNQSQLWNLAEAMKTPRILELCSFAQNCIFGIGEHSYGYFYQTGAEYYFRMMYNITHGQ